MKIAYIMQEGAPDTRERPLGGPANHVWQVLKQWQQMGHEVALLVKWDGVIYRSADLETYTPVRVPHVDGGAFRQVERVVRGLQSRLHLPYFNWFESHRFAEAVRQEFTGWDILYERMGWMGFGGGVAARRLDVPLVGEINNGDFITELERLGVAPQGFQRTLALRLMRWAMHQPVHIAASGSGHRQRFIEWWGVVPQKVSVVENGSELVDLLDRESLPSFAAERPLRPVTFVFVGAFEPWHGILHLIPAMAEVVTAVPEARLLLIGGGTVQAEIDRLIAQHHLEQQVTFTGRLNIQQIAQILPQADIGVAPYCGWMEFSGLKLFDYKAAGLGIVASGQDGQPTTLADGETALIVRPCEQAALAQAMIRLAQDVALRRRLGQAARLEAEALHSWRHTAVEIETILQQAMRR